MTAVTAWSFPRESKEYVRFTFKVGGVVTTTGVEVSITDSTVTRPVVWEAATVIDEPTGVLGVEVGPGTSHVLTPGTRLVFARYADTPEIPVVQVGVLSIT